MVPIILIRNPVLRFFAGLLVMALILALAVLPFLGMGSLLEPWYAQEHPLLYASFGYSIGDVVFYGFTAIGALCFLIAILAVLFFAARELGNWLFRPSVSTEDEG